jgi:hypothetical protein
LPRLGPLSLLSPATIAASHAEARRMLRRDAGARGDSSVAGDTTEAAAETLRFFFFFFFYEHIPDFFFCFFLAAQSKYTMNETRRRTHVAATRPSLLRPRHPVQRRRPDAARRHGGSRRRRLCRAPWAAGRGPGGKRPQCGASCRQKGLWRRREGDELLLLVVLIRG